MDPGFDVDGRLSGGGGKFDGFPMSKSQNSLELPDINELSSIGNFKNIIPDLRLVRLKRLIDNLGLVLDVTRPVLDNVEELSAKLHDISERLLKSQDLLRLVIEFDTNELESLDFSMKITQDKLRCVDELIQRLDPAILYCDMDGNIDVDIILMYSEALVMSMDYCKSLKNGQDHKLIKDALRSIEDNLIKLAEIALHWIIKLSRQSLTGSDLRELSEELNKKDIKPSTIASHTIADRSPPEVQSASVPLAESSSNYLSLKSIATPGDRGGGNEEEQRMSTQKNEDVQLGRTGNLPGGTKNVNPEEHTSTGIPGSDLRELEGEINREGSTPSGRRVGESHVRTSTGKDVSTNMISPLLLTFDYKFDSIFQITSENNKLKLFRVLNLLKIYPSFIYHFMDHMETLQSQILLKKFLTILSTVDATNRINSISDILMNLQILISIQKSNIIALYTNCGLSLDCYVHYRTPELYINNITRSISSSLEVKLKQLMTFINTDTNYINCNNVLEIYNVIQLCKYYIIKLNDILHQSWLNTTDPLPPEVHSTSSSIAWSSSNYLPVNGNATPGDRGDNPVADLREAEGKVNRRATTASGREGNEGLTSGGKDGVIEGYGDNKPYKPTMSDNNPHNTHLEKTYVNPEERDIVNGPQVEPVADLREAEGQLNKGSCLQDDHNSRANIRTLNGKTSGDIGIDDEVLNGNELPSHSSQFSTKSTIIIVLELFYDNVRMEMLQRVQDEIVIPLSSITPQVTDILDVSVPSSIHTVSNFINELTSTQIEYSNDMLELLEMVVNPTINWCQKTALEYGEYKIIYLINCLTVLVDSMNYSTTIEKFKNILNDEIRTNMDILSGQLFGEIKRFISDGVGENYNLLNKIASIIHSDELSRIDLNIIKCVNLLSDYNKRILYSSIYKKLGYLYEELYKEDDKNSLPTIQHIKNITELL